VLRYERETEVKKLEISHFVEDGNKNRKRLSVFYDDCDF